VLSVFDRWPPKEQCPGARLQAAGDPPGRHLESVRNRRRAYAHDGLAGQADLAGGRTQTHISSGAEKGRSGT
jgi:hypothetical protein